MHLVVEKNLSESYRWCAVVEYEGTRYRGWQLQKEFPLETIQEQLECAISKVANQNISIVAAGRTDAGVHAKNQVFHFDTDIYRKKSQWIEGTNHYLPPDIALKNIHLTDKYFNARYSAISRTYQYFLLPKGLKKGLGGNFFLHLPMQPEDLDIVGMNMAAQYLLGVQDFSAFRSSECQAHSPIRIMFFAEVAFSAPFIVVTLKANSFLHHMVRNIVGTLIEVGLKKKNLKDFKKLLCEKNNRKFAGKTIAAKGLYLSKIEYPEAFAVPSNLINNYFQVF